MKKVSSCNFCCGKKFETVIEKIADLQFGLPGEFKILKCHTCDLLFTSPQPSKSEISRYYPGEYSTHVRNPDREPSGFRVVIQKSIFLLFADHVTRDRFIARHLMTWHRMRENVETFNTHYFPARSSGKKVLDIGCGNGEYSRKMKTWGFDVTGCEVDPIAVDRAKAKGVHVLQGDFSELDFQEGHYDVVVMNHVLEHFHDCKAVLRKVRRILKDRGRLILVVPNATALSRVVFEKHWFNWEIPRHLYHFTPETLEKYCSVVGFRKLSIESRSHVSIWFDSVRYKMGIKPMEYKEFLNLRKKFMKVYNSFGAFLNHHNLGDHIAGCFEKV